MERVVWKLIAFCALFASQFHLHTLQFTNEELADERDYQTVEAIPVSINFN